MSPLDQRNSDWYGEQFLSTESLFWRGKLDNHTFTLSSQTTGVELVEDDLTATYEDNST